MRLYFWSRPVESHNGLGTTVGSRHCSVMSCRLLFWLLIVLQLCSQAVCGECYRCMSKYYGNVWEFLGYHRIYKQPNAFTDACADPSRNPRAVPTEKCDVFSNCVVIREKLTTGMGNVGFVRGCYDSIFHWGWNRTGEAGKLQYREMCREFNSTDIVRSVTPSLSKMYICSCRTPLCNGSNSNGASQRRLGAQSRLLVFTTITIVLGTTLLLT